MSEASAAAAPGASGQDAPAAAGASRRGYAASIVLVVVGAAVLLLAYGRVWVTATVGDAGLPSLHVELTGRDLQPDGSATALVALASVAALVATRRTGRLVTGAVLVLLGAVTAVRAAMLGVPGPSTSPDGAVARLVADRTGVGRVALTVAGSPWWALAALGGVLVLLGGVVTLLRSRDWPVLGGRYERAARQSDEAAARSRSASAWDQLDRGVDPTADPTDDPAGERPAGATPPGTADPTLRDGGGA